MQSVKRPCMNVTLRATDPAGSDKHVGMTEVKLIDSRGAVDVVLLQHTQGVVQRLGFVLLQNEDGKFLKQGFDKVHLSDKQLHGQHGRLDWSDW